MKKTTDFEQVKKTALCFLYIDVQKTKFSPIVVMHPIFEGAVFSEAKSDHTINILESEEDLDYIRNKYKKKILKSPDVSHVYNIIRTSYRLTFLKFIEKFLSLEDFSKLLAAAWVSSENPNQDTNVRLATAVRWFKMADKKVLMTKRDYEVYESLPDEITVYRGVAVGRNPKGLSWTANYKTAAWFANRFNIGEKKGYVQTAVARKEWVLAYFNTRNEDELVIDTKMLDIKKIEV